MRIIASRRCRWPNRATTARRTEVLEPPDRRARPRQHCRAVCARPRPGPRAPPGGGVCDTMRHLLQRRHGIPIYRVEQMAFWEESMLRFRPLLALCAIAAVLALTVSGADARAGRGGRFGSRGSSTWSAPPSTTTSPTARPIERSMTQPGQPGGAFTQRPATGPGGSFFNRPGFLGGGFLGGMFAGFLGAGLLGMLFGHGLTGGLRR